MLVKHTWSGEYRRPYFTFYLLAVSVLLLLANIFAGDFDIIPDFRLVYITSPVIIGALALLLNNIGDLWIVSTRFGLAAAILIVMTILTGVFQPEGMFFSLILGVLALTLALWMANSGIVFLFLVSIVSLAYLLAFNMGWLGPIMALGPWIGIPLMLMLFWVPSVVVGMAAAWFYQAIRPRSETDGRHSSVLWLVFLGMAVLMVGYLAYSAFWFAVLYQREELGFETLVLMTGLVGVAAGLAFSFKLRGWQRLGGAAFGLFVPMLLVRAHELGMNVS